MTVHVLVCNVCVCLYFVPCPPLLLVSIIHSFVDDLTLLGLDSNSQQNLLSSPNLFLSSPLYLSICLQQYPSSIVSFHTRLCVYLWRYRLIRLKVPTISFIKFLFFFLPFS